MVQDQRRRGYADPDARGGCADGKGDVRHHACITEGLELSDEFGTIVSCRDHRNAVIVHGSTVAGGESWATMGGPVRQTVRDRGSGAWVDGLECSPPRQPTGRGWLGRGPWRRSYCARATSATGSVATGCACRRSQARRRFISDVVSIDCCSLKLHIRRTAAGAGHPQHGLCHRGLWPNGPAGNHCGIDLRHCEDPPSPADSQRLHRLDDLVSARGDSELAFSQLVGCPGIGSGWRRPGVWRVSRINAISSQEHAAPACPLNQR